MDHVPVHEIGLKGVAIDARDLAAGDAQCTELANALIHALTPDPDLQDGINLRHICHAVCILRKSGIIDQFFLADQAANAPPLLVASRAKKNPAIGRLIHVPRRGHCVAVAYPGRWLSAAIQRGSKKGRHCGESHVVQTNLYGLRPPLSLVLPQGAQHRARCVKPRHMLDQRQGNGRRVSTCQPGAAEDAGQGLDLKV